MIQRVRPDSLNPDVFVGVIRNALVEIKEIQVAFVFGSAVRGDTRPDSDIDVMLVGEEPPHAQFGAAFLDVECTLDRLVDIKFYTPAVFARKLHKGSGFLRQVMLAEPKIWLIGSEELLSSMVNASIQ